MGLAEDVGHWGTAGGIGDVRGIRVAGGVGGIGHSRCVGGIGVWEGV